MTKTGHVMGTPNYMSPEQVQGLKIDPRSDIFSLGAVFYELLTRKKPFSGDSIHATMFKVVQGDREPLARYTHLPTALIEMVDRALDPNVDGRFVDGNALREYIRNIRAQALASGDVDMTVTSHADPTIATRGSEPGSHPSGSSPSRPSRGQSQGVVSGSGSRGTMRQREMTGTSLGAGASASKPMGLYVAGAAVVLAIAAAAFYFTRSDAGSGPSVEELSLALVTSQQELMARSLEQRDYPAALAQAEKLLASDAQNVEALRVRDAAENALAQLDIAVGEARAALERGANAEAAEALGRVLALDPNHPLGVELNDELNQHFQSQAESAQADMTQARSAASSAGARSRPEFRQAESLRQQASDDFNGSEYTNAAQKFLAARDGYQQARSAHQQAEGARRAEAQQSQQAAQTQAEAQASARAELEGAQNAWTRLRRQPDEAGVTEQPSYQRAMSEEANAKRLAGSGDLSGAARGYQTAASYLEAARREYREAEQRKTQEEARRAAASPSPSPPPPPPPPAASSSPSVAQEEVAIRQVLATYERAIEGENIDLFRQVKPNLSADEAKRLQTSFDTMDSHDVELDIQSIAIEGDRATVKLRRRDVIVIRGRSQNGNSRSQVFVLAKTAGNWTITQIGQ